MTACSGRVARCWPARMRYTNRSGWPPAAPRPARPDGRPTGRPRSGAASGPCRPAVAGCTLQTRFMPAMPPLRWTVIFMAGLRDFRYSGLGSLGRLSPVTEPYLHSFPRRTARRHARRNPPRTAPWRTPRWPWRTRRTSRSAGSEPPVRVSYQIRPGRLPRVAAEGRGDQVERAVGDARIHVHPAVVRARVDIGVHRVRLRILAEHVVVVRGARSLHGAQRRALDLVREEALADQPAGLGRRTAAGRTAPRARRRRPTAIRSARRPGSGRPARRSTG